MVIVLVWVGDRAGSVSDNGPGLMIKEPSTARFTGHFGDNQIKLTYGSGVGFSQVQLIIGKAHNGERW